MAADRRIKITHVGSLPRGAELSALLLARDSGESFDPQVLDQAVEDGVRDVVARQTATGIDIVSDGEQSKVTYSTYVVDRLTGFGGHSQRKPALDLADLPELRRKLAAAMGTQGFKRTSCIGPVALKSLDPCLADIRRLRRYLDQYDGVDGFLNAASPGLISAFQPDTHYGSHEAYLQALADAMQPEYEAIAAAGLYLQIDCPDLAMARHTGFQDLSEAQFLQRAEQNVEALNHAVRNIPTERMRIHICWGNYEGPHDHDIPLQRILKIVMGAKPAAILFEAANPRHEHEWIVWRDAAVPDDKILVPGVVDTCTNYIEHPELIAQRIARYVAIAGPDRVIAGTDCGFGTFAGYGKLDPEVSWRKLQALREGADLAAQRIYHD
jgi:5-methyltetrahydropteroyltriglutamate--homocysteine methyltransferase